jgi:hypothetical protein
VAKLKSQGLKGGKIGLTPTPKEPPNKFKMSKLLLKVFFENKIPHIICTQSFFFWVEKPF